MGELRAVGPFFIPAVPPGFSLQAKARPREGQGPEEEAAAGRSSSTQRTETTPPPEERCRRNDGKRWQCRQWRLPGKVHCRGHQWQTKKRAAERARLLDGAQVKRGWEGRAAAAAGVKAAEEAVAKEGPPRMCKTAAETAEKKRPGKNVDEKFWVPKRAKMGKSELEKKRFSEEKVQPFPAANDKTEGGFRWRPLTGRNALSCHQCQRKDKGGVVWCSNCRRKRYCVTCIQRWYPQLTESEISEKCPFCCKQCNCKRCLRMKGIEQPSKKKLSQGDKVQHYSYLLKLMLPFLKEMLVEQRTEIAIEAKIRGVTPADLKLQQAEYYADERILCNYCKTSIVDLHRNCPSCSYDLCLSCCLEIRVGQLPRSDAAVVQHDDRRKDHLHGSPSRPKTGRRENQVQPQKEWKANSDGSVCCPPKELGGCGNSNLELLALFSNGWLSNLLEKAEAMADRYKDRKCRDTCSAFITTCQADCRHTKLRQAACREDSADNYLFCPTARDTQGRDLKHFQKHWIKGEPVIIQDVLESTSGLSWEPMVMWRALRENKKSRAEFENLAVKAIDCMDWCEVGYERIAY